MKPFFSLVVAVASVAFFLPSPGEAQSTAIGNAARVLTNAGAPVNGTNEIQTLTFGGTPTGGTFKLRFSGFTTGSVSWSATNATLVSNIDTALEALSNIGTGGVTTAVGTMTAGIGTITVTFTGNNAKLNVAAMTVPTNALTGSTPTLAVTTTTAGVTATYRGATKGILLVDTTNAALYMNAGSGLNPTWTRVPDLTLVPVPTAAVADLGAVTVSTDIAAFTDPPSAAEMALLRTFVNALKADAAENRAKLNDLLAKLRTGGIVTP